MDASSNSVLGTYSSNGNVSASLTPFGDGWVGLTGAHVEAPKSWCKSSAIVQHYSEASRAKRQKKNHIRENTDILIVSDYNITNPDGYKLDIGYDFVEATMQGGRIDRKESSGASRARGWW